MPAYVCFFVNFFIIKNPYIFHASFISFCSEFWDLLTACLQGKDDCLILWNGVICSSFACDIYGEALWSRDLRFYEILLSWMPFNCLSYIRLWGTVLFSCVQPSPCSTLLKATVKLVCLNRAGMLTSKIRER